MTPWVRFHFQNKSQADGWTVGDDILTSELFNNKMLSFSLPDGSLMQITKVFPLDGVFDNPEDVLEDEVAELVKKDFGSIDILVHSLANGLEVCHS
ncbi:hypothetical protein L2E82_16383 [Cichorium intybus]|uniref:Uncharacterized protein n=1 Tax=Cichorium intybus TaxID=13427 RepID=A0ACB9F4W2_CICIN|nr:hypothetical protein L2E82_16383 [Cichorium intybus]